MKIGVIGVGYVGLVSGAGFSDFGHEVVAFDKDRRKIDRLLAGEMPVYEPGLDELVARNFAAGRLSFATEIDAAIDGAEAIFIAVGTPAGEDGRANLTFVFEAADAIAKRLQTPAVVICKSTVPVGTNRRILERIRSKRPEAQVEIASNPEFLREGSAIEDFKRPDRVVVGASSDHARDVLRTIYRPLSLNETPMLFTDLETAELIKYAANAFLATKITFINEVADICEQVGANVQHVARGMGLDHRIGSHFLHAGPGYGGSCLPKDTKALVETAREAGLRFRIVEAVVEANAERKDGMAARIASVLGDMPKAKSVAILGLTFKPNTDDMREAPSLAIIPTLQRLGVAIRAHDPEGMSEAAAKQLPGVEWCDGPYHAAEGADAVVLLTEWDVYRALDLPRLKRLMRGNALIDLRNVYKTHEVAATGLDYFPVGIRGSAGDELSRREAAE